MQPVIKVLRALKCCQNLYQVVVCLGLFSNDDPGLTLTIFVTGSLVPDTSVWVTAYRALNTLVFPVCSNSPYPQPSGEIVSTYL